MEGGAENLLRDLAIILAVSGVAIVVFRFLKLPQILGYLAAGVLVGPFLLPEPPVSDVETIRHLADIGLVLLLFAIGLEFGWERIRQVGPKVLLIGVIETSFMVALGFQLGLLFGWTPTEAVFLGAAMSISSSAVLVKMLGDAGELHGVRGRLVVGILVVEDFLAVVLLSILSGAATSEGTGAGDIALIFGRLALFSISALVIGTLVAPRIINLVARMRSSEALLIVSLALALGLAFTGELLGISAAAGAFLIGAVIGDSEHSERVTHSLEPVRDVFAALFFVSVGMLIDVSRIPEFIVPAAVVSLVFIMGKLLANTTAVFFMGHDSRTAVRVGTAMPQPGEFSLAMVKVGADHAAVGTFLYPVVAVATAINALVYPIVFRSADLQSRFAARWAPVRLKQYVAALQERLQDLQHAFDMKGSEASQARRSLTLVGVNLVLVAVIIGTGTIVLQFSTRLAELAGVGEGLLGLIVAAIVIALCAPPWVLIWRQLQDVASILTRVAFRPTVDGKARGEGARLLVHDSMMAALAILIAVWAVPLLAKLLELGQLSVPLPLLLLAGLAFVLVRTAFKVHGALQETLARTVLGQRGGSSEPADEESWGD